MNDPFLPYWLLVCHLIGDYLLQSDWMAREKTKKSMAALAHALTYSIPFAVLLRYNPKYGSNALAFIFATHYVIDHWRLARYVVWVKNFVAPRWIVPTPVLCPLHATAGPDSPFLPNSHLCGACARLTGPSLRNHPWAECSATGYHKDLPPWMSVWLMIIADNTLHLVCNGLAVAYYS